MRIVKETTGQGEDSIALIQLENIQHDTVPTVGERKQGKAKNKSIKFSEGSHLNVQEQVHRLKHAYPPLSTSHV